MDEHSENSPSFFKWFNQLELEGLFNIRDEWIVEVHETENIMDQNSVLSTKANDCQFDYTTNAPNYTAPANFECPGEVTQQYATADDSVVAAPVNTESNIIDAYQYNYLPQTNYYESSSMPPQTFEKLNQDERVDQPTRYQNYAMTDADSEHANQFLQNIPVMDNGYSEEMNSIPSYTEPSQESVETSTGYSESVCVTDSTWSVNKEEVSTTEADTDTSICETQEVPVVKESNATQPQQAINTTGDSVQVLQESNSVPVPSPEPPAQQVITIDDETVAPKDENETNSVANGEKSKAEIDGQNVQMCIRSGCLNRAINNPEWEQEFCSNDCVIIHCRNVFMAWVKANETVHQ